MTRFVLDIETAPLPESEIPPALLAKLRDPDDPDWRDQLSFYAPSSSVIAIGLLDPDAGRGHMLVDVRHGELGGFTSPPDTEFETLESDEAGLLRRFWELVGPADRITTYNGRRFDVPVLLQRSLLHDVPATRDLMGPRFQTRPHLDLADVLSLHGATRPYGLAVWTEAIGARNPKSGDVAGADVGPAFRAGRIRAIAEYCARDVMATAELERKVQANWGSWLGL